MDLRLLQVNSRIVSLATALEEWASGAEASADLMAQYTGFDLWLFLYLSLSLCEVVAFCVTLSIATLFSRCSLCLLVNLSLSLSLSNWA